MAELIKDLQSLWTDSGLSQMGIKSFIMILVALTLLFLGIAKKFEPLLLVGLGFGMLLSNLPMSGLYTPSLWSSSHPDYGTVLTQGGLIDILYIGVKTGLYPCLIFIGVGAMTDFGPLMSSPKSFLLGGAAQIGIYIAFLLALVFGFSDLQSASIAIIGSSDGPTAIWLTKSLAPELLGPIAVASYSYMALIPIIQPPIMRALTTRKERLVVMEEGKQPTRVQKICFPILVTAVTVLLLPSVSALIGCLMFGNLLKECGVTERLSDTAQNALMNIVTIFLGLSVGATAQAETFLTWETLIIIGIGLLAFAFSTAGGVLFGKFLCWVTKGKVNPLIGAAAVSAIPMAARVANKVGRDYDPNNYLLMHAMGPNVSGVLASAVVAGLFMTVFGG